MLVSYLSTLLRAVETHIARRSKAYTVGLASVLFIVSILFLPPFRASSAQHVVIGSSDSFSTVAAKLKAVHIIESTTEFKLLARLTGNDKNIQAGRYLFIHPEGSFIVLYRLSHGISGIPSIKITFPEGISAREMAAIIQKNISIFDAATFLSLTRGKEGYLFPDTYLVPLDVMPQEVLDKLEATYTQKTASLREKIQTSGHSEQEVVTMASLLEKEAVTSNDRKIIAGILWKRIMLNMPLQVDAVFSFIEGKDVPRPGPSDLAIDSPYNTYKYRGLPPGPITNPGLEAIEDALTPTKTSYLYYLTGADGKMHYAATFDEHKKNRELYLR